MTSTVPTTLTIQLNLASVHYKKKCYAEAEAMYRATLSAQNALLGLALLQTGAGGAAEQTFERALTLTPNRTEVERFALRSMRSGVRDGRFAGRHATRILARLEAYSAAQ